LTFSERASDVLRDGPLAKPAGDPFSRVPRDQSSSSSPSSSSELFELELLLELELEFEEEFEDEFELELDEEFEDEFELELEEEVEFEFELQLELESLLELLFEFEPPSLPCRNCDQNERRGPSSSAKTGWASMDVATKATVAAFAMGFMVFDPSCLRATMSIAARRRPGRAVIPRVFKKCGVRPGRRWQGSCTTVRLATAFA
jgi:hypothetical protein